MWGVDWENIVAPTLNIRKIKQNEYTFPGELMVEVYSRLEGFPDPSEQPGYYKMLSNIGKDFQYSALDWY